MVTVLVKSSKGLGEKEKWERGRRRGRVADEPRVERNTWMTRGLWIYISERNKRRNHRIAKINTKIQQRQRKQVLLERGDIARIVPLEALLFLALVVFQAEQLLDLLTRQLLRHVGDLLGDSVD